MTERPILFSAPMVRALLAGTKTQTRRTINTDRHGWDAQAMELACVQEHDSDELGVQAYFGPQRFGVRCPYGKPGDRLWVRETWAKWGRDDQCGEGPAQTHEPIYRADGWPWDERDKWRPSIHMPRRVSRITLEVSGVRVERLQDISHADALAEGIEWTPIPAGRLFHDYRCRPPAPTLTSARECYRSLWESINGTGSWEANPWVWVVEFRRAG